MKVTRYINLIKDAEGSIANLVSILKLSGATVGEAVLALMVTREISLEEAEAAIAESTLYKKHKSRKPDSDQG